MREEVLEALEAADEALRVWFAEYAWDLISEEEQEWAREKVQNTGSGLAYISEKGRKVRQAIELDDVLDKTKCPNCMYCIKSLQEDNKRLRETNFGLEEENISLKHALKVRKEK